MLEGSVCISLGLCAPALVLLVNSCACHRWDGGRRAQPWKPQGKGLRPIEERKEQVRVGMRGKLGPSGWHFTNPLQGFSGKFLCFSYQVSVFSQVA